MGSSDVARLAVRDNHFEDWVGYRARGIVLSV